MSMRPERGFTLLEILVAISIFAVISLLCYTTLNHIVDDSQQLRSEQQKWTDLALAWKTMDDDFSFARARTVRNINGEPLPSFMGRPTDPRAVAPPSVEFTRSGMWVLASGTRPGIARIDYRLKDHKLIREIWPNLDRAPEDKPTATTLLTHVRQFDLRFLDTGGQWVDHWPESSTSTASGTAAAMTSLPRAVRVTLRTDKVAAMTRIFEVGD
jgi:general secretion pathway protein J